MEIHRPSTSMRIPPRPSSTSRTNSYASTSSTTYTREPVAIPGTSIDEAPPPLPPPRCIEELDRGIDTAWSWSNSQLGSGSKRELAPIKPGSSLYGGYLHTHSDTRRLSDTDDMEVDGWERPRSGGLAVHAPLSALHVFSGAGGVAEPHFSSGGIPSLTRRPPSPNHPGQRSVL